MSTLVDALRAIEQGYDTKVTDPHPSGRMIVVENPDFKEDNGSSPNLVIDVGELADALSARLTPPAEVVRYEPMVQPFRGEDVVTMAVVNFGQWVRYEDHAVALAAIDEAEPFRDKLSETLGRLMVTERERDAALASLAEKERRIGEADSTARIEGDQIVIRVPISTLPIAFDACPDAPRDDKAEATYIVTDAPTFAKGIVHYLNDESEDGTTRIHRMLDSAMLEALEQGEEGVEERTALAPDAGEDR